MDLGRQDFSDQQECSRRKVLRAELAQQAELSLASASQGGPGSDSFKADRTVIGGCRQLASRLSSKLRSVTHSDLLAAASRLVESSKSAVTQRIAQERVGQEHLAQRRRVLVFESLGQRRVLAVISGTIVDTTPDDPPANAFESPMANKLVYIDYNENDFPDGDDPHQLVGSSGQFEFRDLDTGLHPVKIFGDSSVDHYELTSHLVSGQWELPDQIDAVHPSPTGFALMSQDQVMHVSHEMDLSASLQLPSGAEIVASLRFDGEVATLYQGPLAESSQALGLWVATFDSESVETQLLSGEHHFDSIAFGADGHGVAVDQAGGIVYSLHLTSTALPGAASELELEIQETAQPPVPGMQLVASPKVDLDIPSRSRSRTVIAWPAADASPPSPAMHLKLWSNASGQAIQGSSTLVDDVIEALAFNDRTGLLTAQLVDGISMLDADAAFADLHQVTSAPRVTTLSDAHNGLLSVTGQGIGGRVELTDLGSGKSTLDQLVDFTAIGLPQFAFATGPANALGATFYVVGKLGLMRLNLRRTNETQVSIETADQSVSVDFAINASTTDSLDLLQQGVLFHTLEDTPLTLDHSHWSQSAFGHDVHGVVPVIVQDTEHGEIQRISEDGLRYTPDRDFFGQDRFKVRFHNGQAVSLPLEGIINVSPVIDKPEGILFQQYDVPEHSGYNHAVGNITVVGDDPYGTLTLSVNDNRFRIDGRTLILKDGGLNHEAKEIITLTVSGTESFTDTHIEGVVEVKVLDENDPIVAVTPDEASVTENVPGLLVAALQAIDEDADELHSFTVDDQRFAVVDDRLQLKKGIFLDYEVEEKVIVKVTASDRAGSSVTNELVISVLDVEEQPEQMKLTNKSVMELQKGKAVGSILVNGIPPQDHFSFLVNDRRFEVVEGTLKLRDNQHLLHLDAEQLELNVTIRDDQGTYDPLMETFVIDVLENHEPFHNSQAPEDVNNNGDISPLDAILIINYLQRFGPGPINYDAPLRYYDVNKDGMITPLDAFLVINQVNRQIQTSTVSTEGEDPNENPLSTPASNAAQTSSGGEPTLALHGNGEGEQIAAAPLATGLLAADHSAAIVTPDVCLPFPIPATTQGPAEAPTPVAAPQPLVTVTNRPSVPVTNHAAIDQAIRLLDE